MDLTASPDVHFTRAEIVAVLATYSLRSGADRTMSLVRTSFLRRIANDERIEREGMQQCDRLPLDERTCFCQNHRRTYVTLSLQFLILANYIDLCLLHLVFEAHPLAQRVGGKYKSAKIERLL
jgi:hypothetical protein